MNSHAFPTHALPPTIFNAVSEVGWIVKAPDAITVSAALGVVSISCQSLADLQRHNGILSPLSLAILSICESGERKSTTWSFFSRSIRDHEQEQADAARSALDDFDFELMVWDTKRRAMIDEIKETALRYEETDDLKRMLRTIMDHRPKAPRIPKLIYRDVTPEAFAVGLSQWPSAGIFHDEAGMLFDARTFSNLGACNVLWDGGTLLVDRKNQPTLRVEGARLTTMMMAQPRTFEKFLKGKGTLARDNGFLARYLVAAPLSTQGSRFESAHPPLQTPGLDAFHRRVGELLRLASGVDGEAPERSILTMSPQATEAYLGFFNYVEQQLAPGGCLTDIRDAASKAAENMGRIAALFHFFEGREDQIDVDTVHRAIAITSWYLNEFKRLFGQQPQAPQEQQDALVLEAWLRDFVKKYGCGKIKRNFIRQCGPNSLRHRERLDFALHLLQSWGKIKLALEGKTWYAHLGPTFYAQNPGPTYPQLGTN